MQICGGRGNIDPKKKYHFRLLLLLNLSNFYLLMKQYFFCLSAKNCPYNPDNKSFQKLTELESENLKLKTDISELNEVIQLLRNKKSFFLYFF